MRLTSSSSQRSGLRFAQVVFAIVLTAVCCLALIVFQSRLGARLTHGERFFGYWTQLVCVLLAFWALSMLFARWRQSVRRAGCIDSTIAELSSDPGDHAAAAQWVAAAEAAATRCKNDFVGARIRRLVDEFRATQDVTSVAAALSTESELARVDIESGYAPVRIFAWSIPIVGFVGTVLGIGQAVGAFAALLASGAQRQDEIRAALTRVTADLGFAFQTTLIAVLLTLVVTVLYVLLQHQESRILRAVDELCRSQLLPVLRREMVSPKGAARTENAEAPEALARERMDLDFQWAFELGRLRAELTDAYTRNSELARQYLEGSQRVSEDVARFLKATEESIAAQREALDRVIEFAQGAQGKQVSRFPRSERYIESSGNGSEVESPQGRYSGNGIEMHNGAGAAAINSGDLAIPLDNLRNTIREVSPILRRLAEHLRQQAEETTHPVTMRIHQTPRASAATSGE